MATEKDVVVGSMWQWDAYGLKYFQGGVEPIEFTVTAVKPNRVFYEYRANPRAIGINTKEMKVFLAHVIPWSKPRCQAWCTPAKPCETEGICPVFTERSLAGTVWFHEQWGHLGYLVARWAPFEHAPWVRSGRVESFRSGSGALACDWMLRRWR